VIHWLNSKLNNCEIVAKSSSNCGVLSETTDVTKNANVKSVEKFSTSTPATAETVWLKWCVMWKNPNLYVHYFSRTILTLNPPMAGN